MITARNFATAAENALTKLRKKFLAEHIGKTEDIDGIDLFLSIIKNAIHFSMPDDGKIVDDELRGIRNNLIRLPFENITIEYHVSSVSPNPLWNNEPGIPVKDILILAKELDVNTVKKWSPDRSLGKSNKVLFISYCFKIDGEWLPYPFAGLVPGNWDDIAEADYDFCKSESGNKAQKFLTMVVPIIPSQCLKMIDHVGSMAKMLAFASHDLGGEIRTTLELVEALSCSNVSHEPRSIISKSVNSKRIRSGKAPFYESRILVVKSSHAESDDVTKKRDCERSSPKQHLRRGHIRRLPNSNVWINSCLVGNRNNGFIHKSYKVTA